MNAERVVVTDTASSIPKNQAERLGIVQIPLHIVWHEKTDRDVLDTIYQDDPESFYVEMDDALSRKEPLPTTTAPSVGEFKALYRRLYDEGAREIASVHIMKTKSATHDAAELAAKETMNECPALKIQVTDSQGVSCQEGFIVRIASQLLQQGENLDTVNKILTGQAENELSTFVSIRSLRNLAASGRVNGIKYLASALLKLSVHVEINFNELTLLKPPVRGEIKGRTALAGRVDKEIEKRGKIPSRVGIIYTRDPAIGTELKTYIEHLREMGSVIEEPIEAQGLLGIHAGPGAGAYALYFGEYVFP
jgi:DegV family protein with EDD domain